jgi:hypothetical protein
MMTRLPVLAISGKNAGRMVNSNYPDFSPALLFNFDGFQPIDN